MRDFAALVRRALRLGSKLRVYQKPQSQMLPPVSQSDPSGAWLKIIFGSRPYLKNWWVQGVHIAHASGLRLASTALSLIFGIVAARLIGVEAFGAYASLMALTGFLSVATALGLPTLITREVASARGSGAFENLTPLVQICFFLIALSVLALLASSMLPSSDLILVIGTALAFNLSAILFGANCGYERVLFATWMNSVLRPLVALVVLLLLSLLISPTSKTALLAQLLGAVSAAIVLLMAWRLADIRSGVSDTFSKPWWSRRHTNVLRMGMVFAASQLLINATTQIDILILSALASPEEVAHYYAAARAALVVSFFFGSSAALAEPKLARHFASGQIDELKSELRSTALVGAVLTVASSAMALQLAPYYFDLYGPTFEVGMSSLVVLVCGLIGWSLFGPAQVALRAVRREKDVVIATAFALILNCVASAALIPYIGILGAAIGTAAQFIVYGAIMSYLLYRTSGLRSDIFFWATARSDRKVSSSHLRPESSPDSSNATTASSESAR